MMLEELARRNYSASTTECYIHAVEDFPGYFHRSPDQLGPEHIREFQAHLFTDRKMAPNTVNQRLAALRFLYVKTLRRPWNADESPYPRKVINLPVILSREEVALLIDSVLNLFHRIIRMTLYGTGVRRAELTHLRVSDIDSQRMGRAYQGRQGPQRSLMGHGP
jgi:site-specific recombinase XerD